MLQRYPDVTQVVLRSLPGLTSQVYEITTRGRKILLDATNGAQVSPLSAVRVRELARNYYAGNGARASVSSIERDPPTEIRMRALPLLHTMDYKGRDHFNNPLSITMGTGALWLSVSGLLLLTRSFRRR